MSKNSTLRAVALIAASVLAYFVVESLSRHEEDFADGEARERFETLLAAATRRCTLPYEGRSTEAYAAVGRWIVDHSDHLVAVWDGKPARGLGGTGYVVAYARERGHPMSVVTPPQT